MLYVSGKPIGVGGLMSIVLYKSMDKIYLAKYLDKKYPVVNFKLSVFGFLADKVPDTGDMIPSLP